MATIGPQVLVLTRPKTREGNTELTAAFLNWGIFEWPGIDLEEIDIPLRSFSPGMLPSAQDVAEMVEEFHRNAAAVGRRIEDAPWLERLVSRELQQFDIDPQEIDSYLKEPSLRADGFGTHFIIKPSSSLLADDIDGDPADEQGCGAEEGNALEEGAARLQQYHGTRLPCCDPHCVS